jgi:hypothetical protein
MKLSSLRFGDHSKCAGTTPRNYALRGALKKNTRLYSLVFFFGARERTCTRHARRECVRSSAKQGKLGQPPAILDPPVQVFSNKQSKRPHLRHGLLLWCSIKDDYRTLAELEGVNVVNLYTEIDDVEEGDE